MDIFRKARHFFFGSSIYYNINNRQIAKLQVIF